MKISTKGRYALRFLINIASRTDGKPAVSYTHLTLPTTERV